MATGIIYLDVDDEITSAAARIRAVDGRRVALVVPYGSRVATSRINFRLLSRDALTHEKRLSIVAADAATRALAASAGLPVFTSVGEYDASMEPRPSEATPTESAAVAAELAPKPRRSTKRAVAAAGAAAAGAAAGAGGAAAGMGGVSVGASGATTGDGAETVSTTIDAPTAGNDAATAATAATAGSSTTRPAEDAGPRAVRTTPVTPSAGRRIARTSLIVGIAVLGLAVVVGGVGAYLVLPSASVAVTPRDETIGPLRMSIKASTSATSPDAAAGIVPAETLEVDVEAARTFQSTGKRVEEGKAKGTVRFRNKDFTAAESVPKGSVVSTGSGVRFRTQAAVTVPRAELINLTVFPGSASVRVTAVEAGTDGNVEPNTILVIPRGEDPLTLEVSNPNATKGGSREEFPRVSKKDVQEAVAALTEELDEAFGERIADPDLAASGATVFAETAVVDDAVFAVDPESFIDEELESFDLAATASGTVTAVQTDPVRAIAEERLAAAVEADHQLVEGSGEIGVEDAVVTGETITFPVVATARQVAILDAGEILAAIRGRPIEEARSILGDFGEATLDVWPDWVTTIPTFDGRVDVQVLGPVDIGSDGSGSDEPSSEPGEATP